MFSINDARDVVSGVQEDLVHRVDGEKIQILMGSSAEPLASAVVHKSLASTSILIELCFGDRRSVSSRFAHFDLAFSDGGAVELLTSEENLARVKHEVALAWVRHLLARVDGE